MAHSLTITTPISTTICKKTTRQTAVSSSLRFQTLQACQGRQVDSSTRLASTNTQLILLHRRTMALSLSGALLGLNIGNGGSWSTANAASRRPPPPPPQEKKDPNVSGVQAKILASKKRKEAMKESVAKLREGGKPVDGKPTIQSPTTTEASEQEQS